MGGTCLLCTGFPFGAQLFLWFRCKHEPWHEAQGIVLLIRLGIVVSRRLRHERLRLSERVERYRRSSRQHWTRPMRRCDPLRRSARSGRPQKLGDDSLRLAQHQEPHRAQDREHPANSGSAEVQPYAALQICSQMEHRRHWLKRRHPKIKLLWRLEIRARRQPLRLSDSRDWAEHASSFVSFSSLGP